MWFNKDMPYIIIALILTLAIIIVKKILKYSSEPRAEKDFFPSISNEIISSNTTVDGLFFSQVGGTINDASGLNRTEVYGIVKIKTESDVKAAFQFAKRKGLKVSIAGTRHSLGGQAFAMNALVLDMRSLNNMSVNIKNKVLTVQAGAIWQDILKYLNQYRLSIKSMQSIDILTVGGTLAVNAHGMDHRIGGIASTVKSLRLMLPDGNIQTLSKDHNLELFKAVIGGYGLLGVIVDVQLELMDNLLYEQDQYIINIKDFLSSFEKIENSDAYHMFYARLSTTPSSFLNEMIIYGYRLVSDSTKSITPLKLEPLIKIKRLIFNMSRKSYIGREIKWWSEKHLLPLVEEFPSSRNQILYRSYAYIKNNLRNNTDLLQEYFIPKQHILEFISGLRITLLKHSVITRNVEIRIVHQESILLDYAKGDRLAVVLYLNQDVNEQDNRNIQSVHSELIKLAQGLGGSFYLPYQLNATKEEVLKSYPEFDEFLKLKKKCDPDLIITSKFYEKYL